MAGLAYAYYGAPLVTGPGLARGPAQGWLGTWLEARFALALVDAQMPGETVVSKENPR